MPIMESGDKRLRQLIAKGKLNINMANSVQSTLFSYAVDSNQYMKAILILDAGADPKLGETNYLVELLRNHDNWAPGTPNDLTRRQLILRLRAVGMTETTVMQSAPVRPSGDESR